MFTPRTTAKREKEKSEKRKTRESGDVEKFTSSKDTLGQNTKPVFTVSVYNRGRISGGAAGMAGMMAAAAGMASCPNWTPQKEQIAVKYAGGLNNGLQACVYAVVHVLKYLLMW